MPGLLLPTASNVRPSYKSGFARSAAESANPGLWDGLAGSWCPAVGNTGITTLRDLSGWDNHGTLTGSMTGADWVQSQHGQALDLDGVDDHIALGATDRLSFGDSTTDEPFSIFARVKMDDATRFHIITKGTGTNSAQYQFSVGGDEKLRLGLFDNSTGHRVDRISTSTMTAREGEWVSFASTYDGSGAATGIALYVDGKVIAASNTSGGSYVAMHNTTDPVLIGGFIIGANAYANGQIASAHIYSRILQPAEIADLHADHLAPFRLRRFTPTISGAAEAAAEWQPYWGLHATRFAGILT